MVSNSEITCCLSHCRGWIESVCVETKEESFIVIQVRDDVNLRRHKENREEENSVENSGGRSGASLLTETELQEV